jgi:hypothetical protein
MQRSLKSRSMKKTSLLSLFTIILFPAVVQAQDARNFCRDSNTRSFRISEQSNGNQGESSTYRNQKSADEVKQFLHNAGSNFKLTLPVKGVPISIGAGSEDTDIEKFLKAEREMTASDRATYNNYTLTTQIEGTCRTASPTSIVAEANAEGTIVTFNYYYSVVNQGDTPPILKGIDYDETVLEIDDSIIRGLINQEVRPYNQALTFRALKRESTVITIRTTRGATSTTVVIAPPPAATCNDPNYNLPIAVEYRTREVGGTGEFKYYPRKAGRENATPADEATDQGDGEATLRVGRETTVPFLHSGFQNCTLVASLAPDCVVSVKLTDKTTTIATPVFMPRDKIVEYGGLKSAIGNCNINLMPRERN